MVAVVTEHAPVQGWQQAPLGIHGLGVQELILGKTVPLHCTPATIGKQLP